MAQEYLVLPMTELLTMIEDMHEQFEFSDSVTMAVVYKAKNGKFIIKPAVGIKGLLVNTKADVEAILKIGIPIEEDNPNPFQLNQVEIQNIEANVSKILQSMNVILGIETDVKFDHSYILSINSSIKKSKALRDLYDKFYFSLGVYFGEYIKSLKGGGKWRLQKRFGYNPYYVPVIIGNDGFVYDPWYKLAEFLLKQSKKDLIKHLDTILSNKVLNVSNK